MTERTRSGRRKYQKKESLRNQPEVQGNKTLFEGVEKDDGSVDDGSYDLSDQAQVDRFYTLWYHRERPFKKYAGFRQLTQMYRVDRLAHMIKIQYRHHVIDGEWDEEKFLFVLDKVLENGLMISDVSFERYGFFYEHGREQASSRHSGRTSTIYQKKEKDPKIDDVLSAWDALEDMED